MFPKKHFGSFIRFNRIKTTLGGYEPEVRIYLNAIGVINDSTIYMPSTPYAITGENYWEYLNTTIVNIKNIFGLPLGKNNLSNQFISLYPRFLNTQSVHRYNLVTGLQDATYYGGWTHDGGGATPNGTNGYVDLGISYNTASFTNNNQYFGFISKTNTLTGLYNEFGSFNNGFSNVLFFTNDTLLTTRLNSENNKSLTLSNSLGLFSINRINSTEYKVYQNTSLLATQADISTNIYTPPGGGKIVEAAGNHNGINSIIWFSPRKRTWFIAGKGMTQTQYQNFASEILNLETLLNR